MAKSIGADPLPDPDKLGQIDIDTIEKIFRGKDGYGQLTPDADSFQNEWIREFKFDPKKDRLKIEEQKLINKLSDEFAINKGRGGPLVAAHYFSKLFTKAGIKNYLLYNAYGSNELVEIHHANLYFNPKTNAWCVAEYFMRDNFGSKDARCFSLGLSEYITNLLARNIAKNIARRGGTPHKLCIVVETNETTPLCDIQKFLYDLRMDLATIEFAAQNKAMCYAKDFIDESISIRGYGFNNQMPSCSLGYCKQYPGLFPLWD